MPKTMVYRYPVSGSALKLIPDRMPVFQEGLLGGFLTESIPTLFHAMIFSALPNQVTDP